MIEVSYKVTSARGLDSVPIINGQLIALNDVPGYYYDHNNQRFHVGGITTVSSLPDPAERSEYDNSLYMLTEISDGNPPGLYVLDHDNESWNRIASGSIGLDAPSDGNYYLRKNENWTTPYHVIHCDNRQNDVDVINSAINSLYTTAGLKTLHLKVEGNLLINHMNTYNIVIQASEHEKHLILDFSDLVITQQSNYSGKFIYVGSTSDTPAGQDPGSITIKGLDLTNVTCPSIRIGCEQRVTLEGCRFVSKYAEREDMSNIKIVDAPLVTIRDCSFTFYVLTNEIFMDCGDTAIIDIHGNSFVQIGSLISDAIVAILGSSFQTRTSVNSNTFIGSRLSVYGTSSLVDVSYNNLVIT